MKATLHEETFSFRFTDLPEAEVELLRSALPYANIESRERKNREGGFVAAFELREGMDLEPLYDFIETVSPNPTDYSVWISLLTDMDHDGLSVPAHVLEVVKRIRVGVDFSFVTV